ncbi:MAG TPA: RidA family protein [Acidimicrobiales bacterium]|nr:RidA family protein [Acidimicrobiales bacterium]
MERTAVNPWDWSIPIGFNQAELVEGATKILFCAGQTSIDATGAPQHAGDMAAQLSLSLDNLEAVLHAAGLGIGNLVRLSIFTTDVDAYRTSSSGMRHRLAAAGVAPVATLLGVTRLAFPELMVEIEGTAVS